MFRARGFVFFNWRDFRFESTVFKIQKLRHYRSHTTDAEIDFHILYIQYTADISIGNCTAAKG